MYLFSRKLCSLVGRLQQNAVVSMRPGRYRLGDGFRRRKPTWPQNHHSRNNGRPRRHFARKRRLNRPSSSVWRCRRRNGQRFRESVAFGQRSSPSIYGQTYGQTHGSYQERNGSGQHREKFDRHTIQVHHDDNGRRRKNRVHHNDNDGRRQTPNQESPNANKHDNGRGSNRVSDFD